VGRLAPSHELMELPELLAAHWSAGSFVGTWMSPGSSAPGGMGVVILLDTDAFFWWRVAASLQGEDCWR